MPSAVPSEAAAKHSETPGATIDPATGPNWAEFADRIKRWGGELGFGAVGICDLEVGEAAAYLEQWLAQGRHGDMDYMRRHAALRTSPATLHAGALRVISARMDYRPRDDSDAWVERESERQQRDGAAVISIYARGRDYHKVLRARLSMLATRIAREIESASMRPYCDSAPVLEVEFARKAGLGWRGKHTLLLTREAGSMFFLGEILTSLPLPVDAPVGGHCGTCAKCIDVCPTRAIVAPYQLDARLCISYLTIEHKGDIPLALRPLIGNRVYGCDDCQVVCPWNRFAKKASLADFDVRNGLDDASLVELFGWTEEQFTQRHAGSAILRIGYERWLRNLAVGLGNARATPETVAALRARSDHPSAMVREHVRWALERHAA